MAETLYCVSCSGVVTARMHAIFCHNCSRWQHRKCDTGISFVDYKRRKRGELNIEWKCKTCRNEVVDTPTLEDTSESMDTSAVTSSPRINCTFVVWSPTMPDAPVIDADMDIITHAAIRPADTDELIADFTDPVLEQSLDLDDDIPVDTPETFEEVVNGSKRGGRKLISSNGNTYTVRRTTKDRVFWTCSVRSKKLTCHATVNQYRTMYKPGIHTHIHPADPGAALKIKLSVKVKEVARQNVFLPAAGIVKRTLADMVQPTDHCLPKPENLARAANLHRQKLRPKKHP